MATVAQDVIEVLERAEIEGSAIRLTGQLDRKLYERTAKALADAGGKWNTKAKAILFPGNAAEAIEPILLTGEITSRKVELQAFFTPADLATNVAILADIREGDLVLEPSAGEGALAFAARRRGGRLSCYDIAPSHVKALWDQDFLAVEGDFLSVPVDPIYDRVVMNPPFTRQQDVKHVTHALKFLKPGGRLVAIMSPTWQTRADRLSTEFRELLATMSAEVRDLPAGSFKASGTNVSTVLLIVTA